MRTDADHFPALPAAPSRYGLDGWTILHYPSAISTNLLAANLPAWTAVRADVQTSGRGRFQRRWISNAGGLWLSAVVPFKADSKSVGVLPLVAGLAVSEALRQIGVSQVRMRWPNDVLIGNRKLAGLLLDRFTPMLVVAGIGINVSNQPGAEDPMLENQATRLADWLASPPSLSDLAAGVLRHLRCVLDELDRCGFQSMLGRVNGLWGGPRKIELTLAGQLCRGEFGGVDLNGKMLLVDALGAHTVYSPHEVRHLQEL